MSSFTNIGNFNPRMDMYLHLLLSVEWNYLPFQNFNGATADVLESISYFIPQLTEHMIVYPCRD